MARSNKYLVPVLVVAGVGAVLVAVHEMGKASATPPAPTPPPTPTGPLAIPLLTQFQNMLSQAGAQPGTVNPSQLGLLVSQLQAAGQPGPAAALAALGPVVCQAQTPPGAPNCWTVPITTGTAPPTGTVAPGAQPTGALPGGVTAPPAGPVFVPAGTPPPAGTAPFSPAILAALQAGTPLAPAILAAVNARTGPVPPALLAQIASAQTSTTVTAEQVNQIIAVLRSSYPGQQALIANLAQRSKDLVAQGRAV